MAGLIAMIAVFLVVTIEMTFSTMNGGSMGGCHSGPGLPGYEPVTLAAPGHSRTNSASAGLIPTILEEAPDGTVRGVRPAPRHRRSGSIGTELQKIERGGMGMAAEVSAGNEVWDKSESEDSGDDSGDAPETRALNANANANGRRGGSGGRPRSWSESSQRRAGSRLTEDQQQQKQLLQVMLLEAGILFHSVFIGEALFPQEL